jgi:hypothetical protein
MAAHSSKFGGWRSYLAERGCQQDAGHTQMTNQELSPAKKVIFTVIFATIIIVSVELLASTGLMHLYRLKHLLSNYEVSRISNVNVFYKATKATLQFAGLHSDNNPGIDHRRDIDPSPFFRSDPMLGYRPQPGSYTVTYYKRDGQQWRKLRTNVTINVDGSRWTGNLPDQLKPSLFIFGDSVVYGEGVRAGLKNLNRGISGVSA